MCHEVLWKHLNSLCQTHSKNLCQSTSFPFFSKKETLVQTCSCKFSKIFGTSKNFLKHFKINLKKIVFWTHKMKVPWNTLVRLSVCSFVSLSVCLEFLFGATSRNFLHFCAKLGCHLNLKSDGVGFFEKKILF